MAEPSVVALVGYWGGEQDLEVLVKGEAIRLPGLWRAFRRAFNFPSRNDQERSIYDARDDAASAVGSDADSPVTLFALWLAKEYGYTIVPHVRCDLHPRDDDAELTVSETGRE